jgi:PKD repeat protein
MVVLLSCKKEKEAPLPIADFFVEVVLCNDSICSLKLYDNSQNAVGWEWVVDDKTVSSLKNFTIELPAGGVYKIVLKAKNLDNIEDAKTKTVSI